MTLVCISIKIPIRCFKQEYAYPRWSTHHVVASVSGKISRRGSPGDHHQMPCQVCTRRRCSVTTNPQVQPRTHLAIDPVDLPILVLELAAHVDRHVPQVADHRVHLAHVLLHLGLARVVCDLGDVAALWPDPVAVVHHPLRLVVHDLAVVVALPRAFVLLEAGAPIVSKIVGERRD